MCCAGPSSDASYEISNGPSEDAVDDEVKPIDDIRELSPAQAAAAPPEPKPEPAPEPEKVNKLNCLEVLRYV